MNITVKFSRHQGVLFTWTLGCIHLALFRFHSSLSPLLSTVVKSSITHKRSFIKADRYGGRLQKLITFQCLEPLLSVMLHQACFPLPDTSLPAGSVWQRTPGCNSVLEISIIYIFFPWPHCRVNAPEKSRVQAIFTECFPRMNNVH